MARSQNAFIKKQKAQKKQKKQAEKLQRRLDKKNQETKGNLDDMIAYVDDYGNIISKEEQEESEQDSGEKDNINKQNNENRNS